jgi:hypothetical protein
MRGYSIMSDEDRQSILKQHQTVYDGYATGNVPSNMTPLTVYDAAGDKEGVTVDMNGNVKTYRNHGINEITAKPGNYDEIEPAYEFESEGPQQSMTQMGMGKRPYDFVSQGPSDVYEDELEGGVYDNINFDELLSDDEDLQQKRDQIEEKINESLDMFKRFQKYN